MRTATDKQRFFSLTDLFTADSGGNENARRAAANEHSRNMALIDAQNSSDMRSYLYSLVALRQQQPTQQAEVQDNANRYQTIAIIATIIGAVLIFKNI